MATSLTPDQLLAIARDFCVQGIHIHQVTSELPDIPLGALP